jgi:hypothetical protein
MPRPGRIINLIFQPAAVRPSTAIGLTTRTAMARRDRATHHRQMNVAMPFRPRPPLFIRRWPSLVARHRGYG